MKRTCNLLLDRVLFEIFSSEMWKIALDMGYLAWAGQHSYPCRRNWNINILISEKSYLIEISLMCPYAIEVLSTT